ncbi:hypothetical protein COV23_01955 [Candidatus Wolfebacteria bacterium CG10_big_fil_rev_8_21_14_0_10_31_9]|uniref:Nucleoside 2-deoxyribosyltransferase n=1 Tax=Candidatus Wolfebacteria bacterium CG10_big_fil_rev_8_21_14_0_10_31_9 TaxID=1975070 RepID=A0A2H0RC50_9BACT|nr:MAG: hypothetical protein COV23_01955 [Candidatus Wolfebacteria bacterium CG10_big_fil_rev_8_21_14_0_10_31_9]
MKGFSNILNAELVDLKKCDLVMLLLPAGISSHFEIGIAYGLGKKVVLVWPIANPEIVYLIFDKVYMDTSSFLNDLPNL